MGPSLLEYIRHIHDETSFCLTQTASIGYESFIEDEILRRAIIRSLEIIGEASKNISPDFKSKYPLVHGKIWQE